MKTKLTTSVAVLVAIALLAVVLVVNNDAPANPGNEVAAPATTETPEVVDEQPAVIEPVEPVEPEAPAELNVPDFALAFATPGATTVPSGATATTPAADNNLSAATFVTGPATSGTANVTPTGTTTTNVPLIAPPTTNAAAPIPAPARTIPPAPAQTQPEPPAQQPVITPTEPTQQIPTLPEPNPGPSDGDTDGDGVLDVDDAFPFNSRITTDTDGDGIGDRFDADIDNDGFNNLVDWFPYDPTEDYDYDFDGIGDNADPDDDNDGILDADDPLPFDPSNAPRANDGDIDLDGVPDESDNDIDGDLHLNADDAFPLNPYEWVDTDGDGVGNNIDLDDDGDSVVDALDLRPLDASIGVDSDGDGTPDAYDVNPGSSADARFQVTRSLGSGAATTITSQNLIVDTEVVVAEEPVAASDPISSVAVSPVVDFHIDGPFTNFDTARITLPVDPAFAGQPVEVWWYNEDVGLWVRDGVDLQINAAASTVSVTVDHFSRFVAMRAGAQPVIPTRNVTQRGGLRCVDAGLDVVFAVDVSGSTEHTYWYNGEFVHPSDPAPNDFFGDGEFDRLQIVAELMANLDDEDRAGLITFSNSANGISFDDGAQANALIAELEDRLLPSQDGTNILNAVTSAAGLLEDPTFGSDRNKVIVLVTDGGNVFTPFNGEPFDFTDDSVIDAVGEDIPVHVVGFGHDSFNPNVARFASETGGVYAESMDDDNFGSVISKFSSNDDFSLDSDGDGLTDCEEIDGMALTDAIVWTTGDVEAAINSGFDETKHLFSDANDVDSDGDYLWDSEEVFITDLTGVDFLASDYQHLIDNGISRIFRDRGDPLDRSNPVDADGNVTNDNFEPGLAPSLDLTEAKIDAQTQLWETILSGELPEGETTGDLLVEAYALDWYTGLNTGNANVEGFDFQDPRVVNALGYVNTLGSVAHSGDSNPLQGASGVANEEIHRLDATFNIFDRAFDPTLFIDSAARDVLDQIEVIDDQFEASPDTYNALQFQRHQLMLELGEVVLRGRGNGPGAESFASNNPAEVVSLIESLIATYWYPEDRNDTSSAPIAMSTTAAYRVVFLYASSDFRFDTRVDDLLFFLGGNEDRATISEPPSDLRGVHAHEWERLIHEAAASEGRQLERAILANSPESPFLNENQEAAFEYIIDQFTDHDGLAIRPENGRINGRLYGAENDALLVWEAVEANARVELSPEVFSALEALWDDVSQSNRLNAGWADRATLGATGDFNNQWRDATIGEYIDFLNNELDTSFVVNVAAFRVDDEHSGVVTEQDLVRFSAFMLLRNITPAGNPILENGDDDIVNERDVENFLTESLADGELSDVEARTFAQAALRLGLVDVNFDLTDAGVLAGEIGLLLASFGAAGGARITGRLARAIERAIDVADATTIAIDVSQGNFESAAVNGILFFVDTGRPSIALGAATQLFDNAYGPHRSAIAVLTGQERNQEIVVDGLGDTNFPEIAERLAQIGDVEHPEIEAAYLLTSTRQRSIELLVESEFFPTRQAAEAQFAAFVNSVRDFAEDPEALDSYLSIFATNPDLFEAYGSHGAAVVDENGVIRDTPVALPFADPTAEPDAGSPCVATNSFSGDTLVALADGSTVAISEIQVGDQVLAWNFASNETVARTVTATLPHDDWLLDAYLSDGSILEVTEDHEFWNSSDSQWQELQDVDPGDQLLALDGSFVTIERLDFDAGSTAPAWDLTVADDHNFFVSAQPNAPPVLVHNTGESCAELVGIISELSTAAQSTLGDHPALRSDHENFEAAKALLTEVSARVGTNNQNAIVALAFVSEHSDRILFRLGAPVTSSDISGRYADFVGGFNKSQLRLDGNPNITIEERLFTADELEVWYKATVLQVNDSFDFVHRTETQGLGWYLEIDTSKTPVAVMQNWALARPSASEFPADLISEARTTIGNNSGLFNLDRPATAISVPNVANLNNNAIGETAVQEHYTHNPQHDPATAEAEAEVSIEFGIAHDDACLRFTSRSDVLFYDAATSNAINLANEASGEAPVAIFQIIEIKGSRVKPPTESSLTPAQSLVGKIFADFESNTPAHDATAELCGSDAVPNADGLLPLMSSVSGIESLSNDNRIGDDVELFISDFEVHAYHLVP